MTSGAIAYDRNFSNLNVNGNLTLRNGSVQRDRTQTERPVVINLPVESNITLVPPATNTVIYTLTGPLGELKQTIDIDNSNSFEGQEMIWLFYNTSSNLPAFITLQVEKFISQNFLIIPNGYKSAQYWYNTGNGWEFTVENC